MHILELQLKSSFRSTTFVGKLLNGRLCEWFSITFTLTNHFFFITYSHPHQGCGIKVAFSNFLALKIEYEEALTQFSSIEVHHIYKSKWIVKFSMNIFYTLRLSFKMIDRAFIYFSNALDETRYKHMPIFKYRVLICPSQWAMT